MPTMKYQGREVEGLELRFRTVREDWNEYTLEDGTTLRIKTVVSDIIRLTGQYDQENNPVYVVTSANMIVVKSPDQLKRKS